MPPFFREAGAGPGVVCLHANSSSSGQWRGLIEALSPRFHVLAPDSYGAGKSPPWPAGRVGSLRDEIELLEPVFERAGDPFVLVGHSFGGAVALITAITQPHRVRALVLYEPVLFSVIEAHSPPPNAADGIKHATLAALAEIDAGNIRGGAEHFIDYWMGPGTFGRLPESFQGPIMHTVINLRKWSEALASESTPLAAFRDLKIPVLYMTSNKSPASSLGVARLLTPVLPNVETIEFEGIGHMGPILAPGTVNQAITRFLDRL